MKGGRRDARGREGRWEEVMALDVSFFLVPFFQQQLIPKHPGAPSLCQPECGNCSVGMRGNVRDI